MTYYSGGITTLPPEPFDGGLIVRFFTSTYAAYIIQLYVSGELIGSAHPENGTVEFVLWDLRQTDIIFPLAVDASDADTNYWDDAFSTASTRGNRIHIETPQTIVPYKPGYKWVVYRGDAGDGSATKKVHEQLFYPGGRRSGGYGAYYGGGGYGWDGEDAKGYGYNYGYGEYGYDCEMLDWTSEVLVPGVYPYKVVVEDEYGNASTATSSTVTLNTYARPATNLAVASYTSGTDTIAMTFTASEDI